MPNSESKKINIQLVRSSIGYNKSQQLVLKSLGFRKLNSIVTHNDTPTIRGMVNMVRHIVSVEGEKSAAGIEYRGRPAAHL